MYASRQAMAARCAGIWLKVKRSKSRSALMASWTRKCFKVTNGYASRPPSRAGSMPAIFARKETKFMKSARKAGWSSLWNAIGFSPLLLAFNWFANETASLPVLSSVCTVLSWMTIACIAVHLYCAVWGLAYGYSQKAWNAYVRKSEESTKKLVERACREQGLEPPAWL